MPIEVPQGYPDYMRRSTVTDQMLVNDTVAGASGQQYGVFYVANIPALLVNVTNGVNPVQVEFRWCADRLGNTVIRATHIDVPTGLSMVHTVVPQAPYLVVATNLDSLGDPLNYSLQVSVVPDIRYPTTDNKWTNILSRENIAIAASGTATEAPQVVRYGEVTWSGFMSGGTWGLVVYRVDINGVQSLVSEMDNITPKFEPQRFYWGGGGLLVKVFNGTAAPQTYNVWLTCNPTLGV